MALASEIVQRRTAIRGLAAWVVCIACGCWSNAPAREPIHNEAPRVATPVLPGVLAAELGVFDADGVLHPTADIPLYAGSAFGWRIQIGCTSAVEYREELRLPSPGDWGSDPDMTISAGGKLATIEATAACEAGWIEKIWSVSAGDPPGVWVIRVTPAGFAPHTFRVTFAAAVPATP